LYNRREKKIQPCRLDFFLIIKAANEDMVVGGLAGLIRPEIILSRKILF
jgi:hypothetical protein